MTLANFAKLSDVLVRGEVLEVHAVSPPENDRVLNRPTDGEHRDASGRDRVVDE